MSSVEVFIVGVDRNGLGHCGSTKADDVAEFVRSRFEQGWRSLKVEQDNAVVGVIRRHPATGKRIWWAECACTA
jgi:hypothetical protein